LDASEAAGVDKLLAVHHSASSNAVQNQAVFKRNAGGYRVSYGLGPPAHRPTLWKTKLRSNDERRETGFLMVSTLSPTTQHFE